MKRKHEDNDTTRFIDEHLDLTTNTCWLEEAVEVSLSLKVKTRTIYQRNVRIPERTM